MFLQHALFLIAPRHQFGARMFATPKALTTMSFA